MGKDPWPSAMLLTGGLEPSVLGSWTWGAVVPKSLGPPTAFSEEIEAGCFVPNQVKAWKKERNRHIWTLLINFVWDVCSAYREACRGCQPAHTDLPVRGPLVPTAGTDLPKAGPASDWITSWLSVSSRAHKPKTGHGVWVRVCGFPHGLWCSHGCSAIWLTTYPEIGYIEKRKRLLIIFHLWSDFYVLQL